MVMSEEKTRKYIEALNTIRDLSLDSGAFPCPFNESKNILCNSNDCIFYSKTHSLAGMGCIAVLLDIVSGEALEMIRINNGGSNNDSD